jgi:hypothetical protein
MCVRKRRFFVALVVLIGLSPTLSAWAQGGPTLEVRAGFDGYYKPNAWVPVRAVVANYSADVDGEIRISTQETVGNVAYVQPALLPRQSRKRFTLYAQVGYNSRELSVRLFGGGKQLSEQRLRLQPVDGQDLLFGVVSDDTAALSYLAGLRSVQQRRTHVAHLSLPDLPTQAGAMTSLDMLVLDNVDTSTMSDGQRDALRGWVGMGGHLVICGGPGAALTAAGLGDLLPVAVQGTEATTDLADLGAYGQHPFPDDVPAIVALVSPVAPGAKILIGDADRPLLVRRTLGAGHIDYLALDPDLPPLRTWMGNDVLWPRLVFGTSLLERTGQYHILSGLTDAARNIPALDVPSVLWVVGFLFVYVMVVGPLNLVALRLLNKRAWVWVTVPALIAAFSCVALVAGYTMRGRRTIVSQVSVVRAQLDSQTATLDSFAGLYSPLRRAYDARVPDNVLVQGVSAYPYGMGGVRGGRLTVEQGPPTFVRDVEVDVGAMHGFSMSTVRQWSDVEANIELVPVQPSGNELRGEITNRGRQVIEDCVLVYQSQAVRIPDIVPGETRSIAVAFLPGRSVPAYRVVEESLGPRPIGGDGPVGRERDRRESVLNFVLQRQPSPYRPGISEPVLIGWLPVNPLPVELIGIEGETHATTLLVVPLAVDNHR